MSHHMKKLAAPKVLGIPRKVGGRFVVKPSPGPHPKDRSVALLVFLRDILKVAETAREVKKLLNKGVIKVDGKVRRDKKFPVGFMDVLTVDKKHYRILFDKKGRLFPKPIKKSANLKIGMIVRKQMVKGDKIQLTLHDGRNILLPKTKGRKYKIGASLLIKVPSQEIVKYLPFDKGAEVYLIAGRHVGEKAKVVEVRGEKVLLKGETEYETLSDYAFPTDPEVEQ
ncbi:MAG TPA: 30S ribosomal protein S4e [Candidatus Aenigmarchaeota archaeon]|nr:30S ribosomal protein S4e [Candidatus Aenigmarchaeota archaeon]